MVIALGDSTTQENFDPAGAGIYRQNISTSSRCDVLELLDRLHPTITELSQTIEREVEKFPEAKRLIDASRSPGLDRSGFFAHHRPSRTLSVRYAGGELSGVGAAGRFQWEPDGFVPNHENRAVR